MMLAIRYSKFLLWPSLLMVFGLLFLRWLDYRLLLVDARVEVYSAGIAILFLGLGYFISSRLNTKTQTNVNKQAETAEVNSVAINEVLSARELEVLQLMAKGNSNLEIAASLFISLSTVKTHCSSIYVKLDVKRRTGAVERARALGLIA